MPFWAEVKKFCDAGNSNSTAVLSLPHSNAEVECLSRLMNVVKSKLHNCLSISERNTVLTARTGLKLFGESCSTYNFPDTLTKLIGTMANLLF